jgi:hypothetical protein
LLPLSHERTKIVLERDVRTKSDADRRSLKVSSRDEDSNEIHEKTRFSPDGGWNGNCHPKILIKLKPLSEIDLYGPVAKVVNIQVDTRKILRSTRRKY